MKCPHLVKWIISSCMASDRPYIPSPFELEEYCYTIRQNKCPLHIKSMKDNDVLRNEWINERRP